MLDFLIHSPIRHYAAASPNRPALSFRGASLSYLELEEASNQLANALIEHGLEPHQRVGIFMHKSLELGVAIYGILKAGGLFVPLDPFLPVERLAFILGDCDIRHLVTSDAMASKLEQLPRSQAPRSYGVSTGLPHPTLGWAEVRERSTEPPGVGLIDQDPAYIMYTSGSTGQPKGMVHTHHGSVSYARWGALHVGLGPEDRVASHAPLHFDLSIFDFFSTAQAGGTVVLVPEPVTKLPASWTQYIEAEKISVVFTVPFTLVDMLERGAMDQRDLSSLRWILFGGEPFPPKHLRSLMKALPSVRFTNVYGPAEAPSCTCFDVPAPPEDVDEPIPIGTVSLNSRDLILDAEGEECGVGEPGELCIQSSTLTKGYWNRPDLNERAFLQREGPGPSPRTFYRTGDMVVRHADGLIRFLGRKDRMVKTRGHRVELDDVEAVLVSHPAVRAAAAFTVPDGRGSREIDAAVTLKEGTQCDSAEMIRHARAKLPSYALPRRVAIVDSLPRTSGGKIDRRRLAELDQIGTS